MFLEYDEAGAGHARELVADQAEQWHLSAGSLLSWLDRGTALLPDGAVATVQISYHPADRLLSFDMWTGGKPLFGLDDLV